MWSSNRSGMPSVKASDSRAPPDERSFTRQSQTERSGPKTIRPNKCVRARGSDLCSIMLISACWRLDKKSLGQPCIASGLRQRLRHVEAGDIGFGGRRTGELDLVGDDRHELRLLAESATARDTHRLCGGVDRAHEL